MKEAEQPESTQGAVDKKEPSKMKSSGEMVAFICFLGIFISYFVYGLLQEKITRRTFDGEKFHFFVFLVGFQCVVNACVALAVSWYQEIPVSLKPYRLYPILSVSYVGAMVASNSALAYITYPTQVLGKSAKPIPVLILGVVLGGKHYPAMKYLIVLLIVVGVAVFLYRDDSQKATNEVHSWRLFHFLGLGELLVFLSLTLDGVTGAIQERLRQSYDASAYHMMFAVNVYACFYLGAACLLSGEGLEAVGFIVRHPEVSLSLVAFSLTSAVGQLFIFTTITQLGPLTCSIFTTTRKFFTILASVLLFANPLFLRQWVGVILVFLGLLLDAFYGKSSKPGQEKVKSNGIPQAPTTV
jgi:UDP-galactose transporter B1